MAFEQISLRYANGQESGPASWEQLVQWRKDGRVPDDAMIVDVATGMAQRVMDFSQLITLAPSSPSPSLTAVERANGMPISIHVIRRKNLPSLVAYYCGLFGIIPYFSLLLGPIALIAGIIGLGKAGERKVGFKHALTGILLGSVEIIVSVFVIADVVHNARP